MQPYFYCTINNIPFIEQMQKYLIIHKKWKSLSHVQLSGTQWTVARQAPLSMEFSRPEHWSELLFPSPGDLPDTGIVNPGLLHCRQIPYHLSHQENQVGIHLF